MSIAKLSESVIPRKYALFFKPDLEQQTYEGSVVINVDMIKDTHSIKLHCGKHVVKKASLRTSGPVIKPPVMRMLPQNVLSLEFKGLVKVGWGILTVHFTGYDSLFFSLKPSQDTGLVFSLNAGPMKARRCFPCWDEPDNKTPFELSVIIPAEYSAMSNMPIESVETMCKEKMIKFQTTPVMSTHSLVLAIGRFDCLTNNSHLVLSLHGSQEDVNLGHFPLLVVSDCLKFYENYLAVKYPLPKLDVVAAPDSICSGTGWGMILVGKTLLFDYTQRNTVKKNALVEELSGYVAEQFFGNLVTPERWSHNWVITGAAHFLKLSALTTLYPKNQFGSQFLLKAKQSALKFDAFLNTAAIAETYSSLAETSQISTFKSASVLVMLSHFMGKKFKDGLKYFVEHHQYHSINTQHLWQALEYRSKLKIEDVIQSWIQLRGFPVVIVTSSVQDEKDRVLHLTQKRFSSRKNGQSKDLWWIPLTFSKSSDPTRVFHKSVMFTEKMKITLSDIRDNEWIKINSKSIGFYRVYYPTNLINSLMSDLVNQKMPIEDQIGLLSDYIAFVKSGIEKTSTILALIAQLGDRKDYQIWNLIIDFLNELYVLIPHTGAVEGFKEFVLAVLKSIYHELSWYPKTFEDELFSLLRPLVLEFYSKFEDESALGDARKRFNSLFSNTENVHEDLRRATYYVYACLGGQEEFEKLTHIYNQCSQHEQENVALSLHGFRDENVIRNAFSFFLNHKNMEKVKTLAFLQNLLKSHSGPRLAWDFIQTNYDHLKTTFYKDCPESFNSFIEESLSCYPTEERLVAVQSFVKEMAPIEGEECLGCSRGLEKLEDTLNWLIRDKEDIEQYFMLWAIS